MIGFNRRFDPGFGALKSAVQSGEIGSPELLSITSFDPAPPPISYVKVSGGIFRDMTIHDFDICQWLMGGLPETVTAKGSSIVDPDIGAEGDFDTAVITMTAKSSARHAKSTCGLKSVPIDCMCQSGLIISVST